MARVNFSAYCGSAPSGYKRRTMVQKPQARRKKRARRNKKLARWRETQEQEKQGAAPTPADPKKK